MGKLSFEVRIFKDGRIQNEVTAREGVDCGDIRKVTSRLGVEESDETLPDCAAEAHNTVGT